MRFALYFKVAVFDPTFFAHELRGEITYDRGQNEHKKNNTKPHNPGFYNSAWRVDCSENTDQAACAHAAAGFIAPQTEKTSG